MAATDKAVSSMQFQWQQCKQLPVGMRDAQTVFLNGKVYVGGGITEGSIQADCTVYAYDFFDDAWDPLPTSPVSLAALVAWRGLLLLVGGIDASTGDCSNKIWAFDEESQSWINPPISCMQTARSCATAVVYRNRIIVLGGKDADNCSISSVLIYDEIRQQWLQAEQLPTTCSPLKSATNGEELYLVDQEKAMFCTSLESLVESTVNRPKQRVWTVFPSAPLKFPSIQMFRTFLLSVGGWDGDEYHSSIYSYTPETHSWTEVGEIPIPCHSTSTIVFLEKHVLIAGGWAHDTVYSTLMFKANVTVHPPHHKFDAKYPEVYFLGDTHHEIVTTDGKVIKWKDIGVTIKIPPGAVSEQETIDVSVRPCWSGPFQIPDEIDLASPLHLVGPAFKFRKKIKFSLRHFSDLQTPEDCKEMTFLSAPSTPTYIGSKPTYILREIKIEEGAFTVGNQIATIFLKHLCLFSVGKKKKRIRLGSEGDSDIEISVGLPKRVKGNNIYSARLYWNYGGQQTNFAVFAVCLCHPLHVQNLDNLMEQQFGKSPFCSIQEPVCLSGGDVSLSVPKNVLGWKVSADRTTKISKDELDLPLYAPEYAQFSGYPPKIHLTLSHVPPIAHNQIVQMETDCTLQVLGLKEEVEFHLPLPKPCVRPVALMSSTVPSACQSGQELTEGHLRLLLDVLRSAAAQWKMIGIGLHFSASELEIIERRPTLIPMGSTGFLCEMLTQWLKWSPPVHPLPTVESLVLALRYAREERLAVTLQEKLGTIDKNVVQTCPHPPSKNSLTLIEKACYLQAEAAILVEQIDSFFRELKPDMQEIKGRSSRIVQVAEEVGGVCTAQATRYELQQLVQPVIQLTQKLLDRKTDLADIEDSRQVFETAMALTNALTELLYVTKSAAINTVNTHGQEAPRLEWNVDCTRSLPLKIPCESVQSRSSEDGTQLQLPEQTAQLLQLEEHHASEESIQFQVQEGSAQLLVPKENIQLQLPKERDPLQPQCTKTIYNKPADSNWSQCEIDSFHAHFSLQEVIMKYYLALEHSKLNHAMSPTKLLCFTHSSPLIHQLPAQYPSSVSQAQVNGDVHQTLCNLVFPEPSWLVVCKLSSLLSQSSVQKVLRGFVRSDTAKVCLLVASMQDTSCQVVNHLRIMIEDAEQLSTREAKLFVMLLHFTSAQFFDPCYPSLFLKGWDHCYLDTVAHSAVRGVVDIQDWFWQCCFPQQAPQPPERDSLVLALKDILPEAIPVLSSHVFFGSSQAASFNRPMSGSQRSEALMELLFKKGVGRVLCERFHSYWKPAMMAEYLERAAKCESALNITDFIQTKFRSLFFDFLVYLISRINEEFNIDILFDSDCTPAVQELFLDILRVFPLPKLSQIQAFSTNLPPPMPDHPPRFPFFKVVCKAVERITEQSHEVTNKKLDLLQEEEVEPTDSTPYYSQDSTAILSVLQEVVMERITRIMEATPKESLVLAVEAMGRHFDLWQRYFNDFLLHKLRLGDLRGEAISQQILHVFFRQLHEQGAMIRMVSLHCYIHIYHLNLAKMAAVLRPLNQIQQIARTSPHLLSPSMRETSQEFITAVRLTPYPLGTPEILSSFVVNTLFSAIVGSIYGQDSSEVTVLEKTAVWFRAYRDVMSLPMLKQHVYVALEPQQSEGSRGGKGMEAVEAQLNVMQAVFLVLQSSPSLKRDILLKGQQIFQSLFNRHFTANLEQRDQFPHLADVTSVAVEIMTSFSPSFHCENHSIRLLMEGLFAHYFSSHRHGYHYEDVHWFLELANEQEQWGANPLEHSVVVGNLSDDLLESAQHQLQKHHPPATRSEVPQGAISMCVFKLYLGRILGLCDQHDDEVATLSGPLLLYHHQPRSQVGRVLMATPDLGPPAPYIPTYYQECSPIQPKANSENQRMQQPLIHLYFLTVLEHLQAEGHKLSALVRTANNIHRLCTSPTVGEGESVILWVELQAVVQMVLQQLATHLDPSEPHRIGEVQPLAEDINRILDDVETGGGDSRGHGMVLALHMMKLLNSSRKFTELLTTKYDLICRGLNCLQPFHEQLTFAQYSPFRLHQVFLDIRYLELRYPHYPSERDFTHSVLSSGDIQHQEQGGDLYLLAHFAQEWPRLQAGGMLLPDLVEFYQWLHTALAHMVTYERATSLPIGHVVDLAVRRYSQEMGEYIRALYTRVKDGYNKYVELLGGAIGVGACAVLREGNKVYTIADDIPLLHFLSDVVEEEQGNDWLYTVVADIIAAHNAFIEGVYSYVQAQQQVPLARLLPDEPAKVYPLEVDSSNCIVGKFESLHGINDFLQLVRSRYQPPSYDTPTQSQQYMSISQSMLQTTKAPEFQLYLLQEDIVTCFLAGKPLIRIEPSSLLRTFFKFRQSPGSITAAGSAADVVGSAQDLEDIAEKLPDTFKVPLQETLQKRMEYEFHSASYHTMVEVVTGLRIVARHLITTLLEQSSEGLEKQTIPQFMMTLYNHLDQSGEVLGEIGVRSPSPSQMACLIELPLPSLFCCMQLFASWVRDGVYDFAALPFGVKAHMTHQDVQSVQQIPLKWTGSRGDLLEEIKQMNEVLQHSEAHIMKTANEDAHKPIMQYLQEIHILREEDLLPNYIPPSILIQHYVSFRMALRRLVLRVQQQVEAEEGDTQRDQWREFVGDLWDNQLPHLHSEVCGDGEFVFDPHTGRYGFQEGYEFDSEGELMDDLMNKLEEDYTQRREGKESFLLLSEEQRPSLESIREEEEDELQSLLRKDPEFQKKILSMARSLHKDTVNVVKGARDYTPAHVGRFLEGVGLGHHLETFCDAEISGEMLLDATEEMLEELGVTSATERLKIKVLFRRSLQGGVVKYPLQTVMDFLKEHKLEKYCTVFQERGMDGDLLLEADNNVLKELGVKSPVDCIKIKTKYRTFVSS